MSTQAQIKANRRNAKLSTGPRTPEGKQQVAANPVSHGLAGARFYILPGEDPKQFDTVHEGFRAEHLPATLTEDALVLDLARAHWKMSRASRLQAELDPAAENYLSELLKLDLYETTARRSFHAALDQLRKLRAERRREAESRRNETKPNPSMSLKNNPLAIDLREIGRAHV